MAVIMVVVAEEGGEVKLSGGGGTRLEYVPEHRRCLGPGAGERNCDCDDLCVPHDVALNSSATFRAITKS